MKKLVVLIGLFLPWGAYAQSQKSSAELRSDRAAETAEMMEVSRDLQKVCEAKSLLKMDAQFSINVCSCMVKNHRLKLSLNEMKSVLRFYRAAPRKIRAKDISESELWEYDLELAEKCVKNTEFGVLAAEQ